MNALVETVVTALTLSGLAAACLVLLPHAPPRLKFAVAVSGIAAWLVPWGAIRVALPADAIGAPLADILAVAADTLAQPPQPWLDAVALLCLVLAAASLAGLALFVGDCLALRRCVRRWHATSRPADDLRSLLPPELKTVPAEIRVVANSNVAAASGYLVPTIWIGDGYRGERLRLTLVHEMWHVRGRDPIWLALLAAVRRAYWWNPLVAYLARVGLLMIESICDHRSAKHFEKSRYAAELASLLLADAAPAPRLLATMQAASLNVQRVRLLHAELRLRPRDLLLVAMLGASAAAAAITNVVERVPSPSFTAPQSTAQPDAETAAGQLLAVSSRADRSDGEALDDLLASYAPQQHSGELTR
jgi:beta-lactamase regulating signal transducer with metallopeptidase domain